MRYIKIKQLYISLSDHNLLFKLGTLNRGQMGFPSAASSSTPVMADSSILPIRFNPDNSAPIPSNLSMEDMSIDED